MGIGRLLEDMRHPAARAAFAPAPLAALIMEDKPEASRRVVSPALAVAAASTAAAEAMAAEVDASCHFPSELENLEFGEKPICDEAS